MLQGARGRLLALVAGLVALALLAAGARLGDRVVGGDSLWANALAATGGGMEPFDLAIFLAASDDALAGRNPYPQPEEIGGGELSPYAYPPVLALALAPLAALPERAGDVVLPGLLFSALLIAATVGALLLLGVRDWRCYPLVLLSPPLLESLEYGAVGPLLLLLVAAAWRWRDAPAAAGAAAGALVVLKLFVWPVLAWLVLTRRVRAALLGAAGALALALAAWAAIAFRGLAEYPELLRELADLEAESSYSAYALVRAGGLPSGLAQALVVAAGLALLALAWRAARRPDGERERDRRSLTLVLAAALVLTPILWLHYLVLLAVPIALARPRLSPLWLLPFALSVFEALDWYRGWPRGDGEALLSVAAVCAAVFAGALRAGGRPQGRAEPVRT